jgi:hypothetical protein
MSLMSNLKGRQKSKVSTIEECLSCGQKTKRAFQSGDFVYKVGGECTKCKGKMKIVMIYGEKVEE